MRYNNMLPFRAALAVASLFVAIASAQLSGLTQEYCSSENTGSDYDAVSNIYQSNGACSEQCVDNYAFAVVQYQNCWCSNYIPADQEDTGSCSQKCPGYPDDLCGNKNTGLYGYIKLRKPPSGTAGAASSTQAISSSTTPVSTSTPTAESSSISDIRSSTISSSTFASSTTSVVPSSSAFSRPFEPSNSFQTISQPLLTSSSLQTSSSSEEQTSSSVAQQTSSISTSASTTPTSTPSSSAQAAVIPISSSSIASSATPSAVVTTRVITQSGAVVTQTVTSTPIVIPHQEPSNESVQRHGLSGGAIAGIVIAVLLALLAVAVVAFFLWRRLRQQDHGMAEMTSGKGPRTSPRRNVSVLSKAGLLARGNNDMAENTYDESLYVNAGMNSVRHSMLFGAGANTAEGVSPVSPLGSSHDAESGNKRYSRPLVYDQRLNPSALFANQEANGSRVSIQDNADYSRSLGRTLGVANPDPRASFDSRTG